MIRVSEWSRTLWQEVWDCNKYDDVTFYEQSALIRRLRAKREGLGKWSLFFLKKNNIFSKFTINL